ncbi:MAG: amidohydrolase family protein [Nitrososphaerota archaeon]|nr:amidohydrolase family protein [Nitrososphaerales archaeon]MDW8045541.1 amidohydrolase family protein [Nitrososphaerota archaeon]
MIINLGYALLGKDLELGKELHIEVVDGVISHIGKGYVREASIDMRYGVAIPALVNAHLHILDYAFLEYGIGLKIEEVVSEPHGLKHRLLSTMSKDDILYASKRVFFKLFRSGVTIALIFSELPSTYQIIRDVAKESRVKAIVLGRARGGLSIDDILKDTDGLGLDSPLRYDVEDLVKMRDRCRAQGRLIVTHVAETKDSYLRGDFRLALDYLDADILIHGTQLGEEEMEVLVEKGKSLVVCPRSNMWFGVGLPPIAKYLEYGVNLLIGTDNAGLIEPDLWRELEAAYFITKLKGFDVDARDILKMATVNIEGVKGLNLSNVIEEGRVANFIILDAHELEVTRAMNLYNSILKRGSSTSILKVIGDLYL